MKIKDLIVGELYAIKDDTMLDMWINEARRKIGQSNIPILRGWKAFKGYPNENNPPVVYLGYRYDDWTYFYRHTKKHHYVFWKGQEYLMDNWFADRLETIDENRKRNHS